MCFLGSVPVLLGRATRVTLDVLCSPGSYCLMTMNQEATIGPCGPRPRPPAGGAGAPAAGAGAGPRSGWNRYTLCVTGSTAIVFAPAKVVTVSTTVYLSAES